MAEHESKSKLHADLVLAEERLSERTRERDEVQLRLVKSAEQISSIRAELAESARHQKEIDNSLLVSNALLESKDLELAERTANLAAAALELSQRTNQLHDTNNYLMNRTAELEKSNAELKALLQQREDFVAALTHDLKNPLIGCTKLLEYLADGLVPIEQQPLAFKQLIESNKSMLVLIWNLLDVYRHESGSLVPSAEPVDLPALLTSCLNEFSFSLDQKKLQLHIDIAEGLPIIQTDKFLLRRVLVNLISNGIKFSPERGKLVIKASCDQKYLSVAIKDSGPGMSAEHLRRLFERFSQTEEGRRNGIGTGLGLYLSKQIMELLNGRIECESTPKIGTTFTILLKRC